MTGTMLCLALLGPEKFLIPAMLLITFVLTFMRKKPWGKMFYDLIYKQLNIPNDNINKVLDFGAGFCITADHYAKNHDVTAVEPSEARALQDSIYKYMSSPEFEPIEEEYEFNND